MQAPRTEPPGVAQEAQLYQAQTTDARPLQEERSTVPGRPHADGTIPQISATKLEGIVLEIVSLVARDLCSKTFNKVLASRGRNITHPPPVNPQ